MSIQAQCFRTYFWFITSSTKYNQPLKMPAHCKMLTSSNLSI